MKFSELNLHSSILSSLEKKGYTEPTPIQEQAIPHLLEGRDLLGIAQTGTGKTAAFSLPLINRLLTNKIKAKPARTRALILTPTRELAGQINDNIKLYSKDVYLKSAVMFGGVNSKDQIANMIKGLDILVATPGRLLDLMNEGHVLYDQLEVFILDEADRMLDMGFINDVKKIIKKLPPIRQTLLFSATMPSDIAELSKTLLKDPIRVEVTPEASTVERIDQRVNIVDQSHKSSLLKEILKDKSIESVLIFTRTKHGANRIVEHLAKSHILAAAIHGNKSQSAREKALKDFRSGQLRVLVATDIAARGIDVDRVTHVINYDLPEDPKSYVHRIGRTARAGRDGMAISFCSKDDLELLRSIEKLIKYKIPVDESHAFHGVPPLRPRPQNGAKHSKLEHFNGDENKASCFKHSINTKRTRTAVT
ncbi:MAG: DEAD/DEAH box helicase [Bdellovibrio sp.]